MYIYIIFVHVIDLIYIYLYLYYTFIYKIYSLLILNLHFKNIQNRWDFT